MKESGSLQVILVEIPQTEIQRGKKRILKNKNIQELQNSSKKHNIPQLGCQKEKKEIMELKKYLR